MTSCSRCGAAHEVGARFCEECGSQLSASCPSCGADVRPGAKFCKECGASQIGAAPTAERVTSPTSEARAPAPVAERKVTSVLFGDLVGFTTLSEALDKEDVREMLSGYFTQCRRIVARYGGTIEKFIGDAVMAVWGVPAAHDDDAERAVRAGLELVRAVETLGEERDIPGLALRVGVVTGEVAVTLGAEHEGMVAGDAVNTAARVQSVADPGQVWVDETTRLLTSGAITYVDVGSHELKGKAEPVPLWAVRAVVAAIGGAQRADGLEAPLTGRTRELRLVKEILHGVEDTGRPALVLVNGEPGVGKSRLGWEFEKYIDGMSVPFSWHSTRCLAYGEGVAFWPIAEAVRGRLGLVEAEPDADPEAALDLWLARSIADPEEVAWLRPRLLVLLGRGGSGGYDRDDLFSAWRIFLERTQGENTAVVLLIDDAQHADDGTVQFVEHLLAHSEAPLFVMLLARPDLLERWPALATNRRATVLHLATLDSKEMAALLDGLVTGLPEDVRDGLVERAQGVPLYAIETIRSLIDRDLIVPRGGVYLLPDPSSVDLAAIGAPASLQALVAARLDGLPAEQRRVVADASVLGLTFTRDAIGALAVDVVDLDATLAALTRLEIFGTVTSRLSAEYGQHRFIQPVVRQVAYSTQSRRDRKARHLAVVAHLEGVGDPSGDHAPVLAQHLLDAVAASGEQDPDVADLRARAVAHLTTAATRARSLEATHDALRYIETALSHADDEVRPALHLDAAWAALEGADAAKALEHGEEALARFTTTGDAVRAGSAAAAVAQTTGLLRGENGRAVELARPHWEALRDTPGIEPVLLQLAMTLSSCSARLGLDIVDIAAERTRLAHAIGDAKQLAEGLTSLAGAFQQRVPIVALHLNRAAADIVRQEQLPSAAAMVLTNLAGMYLPDDVAEAAALNAESLENSRRIGANNAPVAVATANLAGATLHLGDIAGVEQLLDQAPDLLAAQVFCPWLDALVADVTGRDRRFEPAAADTSDEEVMGAYRAADEMLEASRRGDHETAAALGDDALRMLVDAVGLTDDTVLLWPHVAEAALAAGDDERVARALAPIDDSPPGLVGRGLRAHRSRFTALQAIAAGDARTVERDLREAIAGFDLWGSKLYRARTQGELANWLRQQGRTDDAVPLRRASQDFLEAIGASRWLDLLGWSTAELPLVGPPS